MRTKIIATTDDKRSPPDRLITADSVNKMTTPLRHLQLPCVSVSDLSDIDVPFGSGSTQHFLGGGSNASSPSLLTADGGGSVGQPMSYPSSPLAAKRSLEMAHIFVDTKPCLQPPALSLALTGGVLGDECSTAHLNAWRLGGAGVVPTLTKPTLTSASLLHEHWIMSTRRYERNSSSSSDSGVVYQLSPPSANTGTLNRISINTANAVSHSSPSAMSAFSVSPPGLSPLQIGTDSAFSTPTPYSASTSFTFDPLPMHAAAVAVAAAAAPPTPLFHNNATLPSETESFADMLKHLRPSCSTTILSDISTAHTLDVGRCVASFSCSNLTNINDKFTATSITADECGLLRHRISSLKSSVFRSESLPAVRAQAATSNQNTPSPTGSEVLHHKRQRSAFTAPRLPVSRTCSMQIAPRATLAANIGGSEVTPITLSCASLTHCAELAAFAPLAQSDVYACCIGLAPKKCSGAEFERELAAVRALMNDKATSAGVTPGNAATPKSAMAADGTIFNFETTTILPPPPSSLLSLHTQTQSQPLSKSSMMSESAIQTVFPATYSSNGPLLTLSTAAASVSEMSSFAKIAPVCVLESTSANASPPAKMIATAPVLTRRHQLFSKDKFSASMSCLPCLSAISGQKREIDNTLLMQANVIDSNTIGQSIDAKFAQKIVRKRQERVKNGIEKNAKMHKARPKTESSAYSEGANGSSAGNTESPFICDYCHHDFRRQDILMRHVRRHTGERPFHCDICQRYFSRSDHLRTHKRTHTDEKPYKCQICNYAARRRDVLTRHVGSRHRMKASRTVFPCQRRTKRRIDHGSNDTLITTSTPYVPLDADASSSLMSAANTLNELVTRQSKIGRPQKHEKVYNACMTTTVNNNNNSDDDNNDDFVDVEG